MESSASGGDIALGMYEQSNFSFYFHYGTSSDYKAIIKDHKVESTQHKQTFLPLQDGINTHTL